MKPGATCLTTSAISRVPRRLQLARLILPPSGISSDPPPSRPPPLPRDGATPSTSSPPTWEGAGAELFLPRPPGTSGSAPGGFKVGVHKSPLTTKPRRTVAFSRACGAELRWGREAARTSRTPHGNRRTLRQLRDCTGGLLCGRCPPSTPPATVPPKVPRRCSPAFGRAWSPPGSRPRRLARGLSSLRPGARG